jgi:hypothetical protein
MLACRWSAGGNAEPFAGCIALLHIVDLVQGASCKEVSAGPYLEARLRLSGQLCSHMASAAGNCSEAPAAQHWSA